MSGLHQASLVGNTDIMKMLLEGGALIDSKDSKGKQTNYITVYPLLLRHSPKRAVDIYHRNASERNCGLLEERLLSIFSDRPSTQFVASQLSFSINLTFDCHHQL